MRKSRLTEIQIIGILKAVECLLAGLLVHSCHQIWLCIELSVMAMSVIN